MSNNKRDLADFIGSNSMLFFLILDCSNYFLIKPPEQWTSDEDYLSTKEIVNHMSVVNDAAKRGVKLASDFVSSSRNEDTFQKSLQIIEDHTKHVQNQTRKYRSKKM